MSDTKLADLTALTTPSGDDLLYVVDDPSGTPADRKLALDNLFTRGTVTVSSPVIDAAQEWNDGGVTFTGLKFNATDTASDAASLLMDLQVGGVSRVSARKDGVLFTASISSTGTTLTLSEVNAAPRLSISSVGASVRNAGAFVFSSTGAATGTPDLLLTRRAAANLRLGAADAAAPVAQTLSVQSVVAGTTNTAGANLTITGSQGTGTGAGGSIIFQVAPAGSSGTAQNALATALTITSAKKAEFDQTIKTGAPSGGTAAEWKLGTVATVSPTSPNRTIEVEIGGTTYYISAKTTND